MIIFRGLYIIHAYNGTIDDNNVIPKTNFYWMLFMCISCQNHVLA